MTIGVGYGIAAWWRDGHTEDVYRALDELALAGFDGVELFGPGLRPFIDRPVQFRRLLDLHGLTLTSVYSSFAYLDPSRRGYEDEDFRRNVAFAAEAGSKWARTRHFSAPVAVMERGETGIIRRIPDEGTGL